MHTKALRHSPNYRDNEDDCCLINNVDSAGRNAKMVTTLKSRERINSVLI